MEPDVQHRFRDNTAVMSVSSINRVATSWLTFQCMTCRGFKPRAGRVALGHKLGFRCADCVAARAAKRAAKVASCAA